MSFAQQTGISVLATLAATAVLALISAWHPHPPSPAAGAVTPPSLTSGGKFAARAAAGSEANQLVTMIDLPPVLPMFTAPAVPALDIGAGSSDVGMAAAPDGMAFAPPARAAARPDARRVAVKIPMPPRPDRSGGTVVQMAALPDLPPTAPAPSLWDRSRTMYDKVAGLSGAMLDHLLP